MEIQFRSRNHDMGAIFPTFQERVNSMLPADSQTSAAPVLEEKAVVTPHMPTNEEISQTLAQVEREAQQQGEELIQMHSGLNAQRVARLLDLLD
ncbi:MAG: pseudouridine synthase [Desulfovibrio sp.]|nr:pseudouridine synthase [Desulfovibrio sp.]